MRTAYAPFSSALCRLERPHWPHRAPHSEHTRTLVSQASVAASWTLLEGPSMRRGRSGKLPVASSIALYDRVRVQHLMSSAMRGAIVRVMHSSTPTPRPLTRPRRGRHRRWHACADHLGCAGGWSPRPRPRRRPACLAAPTRPRSSGAQTDPTARRRRGRVGYSLRGIQDSRGSHGRRHPLAAGQEQRGEAREPSLAWGREPDQGLEHVGAVRAGLRGGPRQRGGPGPTSVSLVSCDVRRREAT
jgi:hypothetical protein